MLTDRHTDRHAHHNAQLPHRGGRQSRNTITGYDGIRTRYWCTNSSTEWTESERCLKAKSCRQPAQWVKDYRPQPQSTASQPLSLPNLPGTAARSTLGNVHSLTLVSWCGMNYPGTNIRPTYLQTVLEKQFLVILLTRTDVRLLLVTLYSVIPHSAATPVVDCCHIWDESRVTTYRTATSTVWISLSK